MPTWLMRFVLPLAGAALLVYGVVSLGRFARDRLAAHDRYTLAFTAIDCASPPGVARDEFLSEIQYLAGMPDRIRLLDRETPLHLMTAFSRHPWVERVERVEVRRDRLRVLLTYREPVLAVSYDAGEAEPAVRAVDRSGVLLPVAAACESLPAFVGASPAPIGAVGAAWGDARVEAAARTAAILKPHQEQLQLRKIEIDDDGDVWLLLARGRVRWGAPPGTEAADGPSVEDRVRELLGDANARGT